LEAGVTDQSGKVMVLPVDWPGRLLSLMWRQETWGIK
jgi:hypothetical protein